MSSPTVDVAENPIDVTTSVPVEGMATTNPTNSTEVILEDVDTSNMTPDELKKHKEKLKKKAKKKAAAARKRTGGVSSEVKLSKESIADVEVTADNTTMSPKEKAEAVAKKKAAEASKKKKKGRDPRILAALANKKENGGAFKQKMKSGDFKNATMGAGALY